MARPLASLMKPILENVYKEKLPERKFLAPTRFTRKTVEVPEDWMRPENWKDIIYRALAKDPASAIKLGEETIRAENAHAIGSKVDVKKQEKELSYFRQAAETVFLPEFKTLIEHFGNIIQGKKEVLIIDDYTYKGETMRIFAALARQFPEVKFSFFSAIVDARIFRMQEETYYPENFIFLKGREFNAIFLCLDYSRKFHSDKEGKRAATGVEKSSDSPISKVSSQRVPSLVAQLRKEMRELGVEIAADFKKIF